MEQTIINSSPLTQEWISILMNAVLEKNSDVEFRNTKYWVIVENKTTNRKIACFNPRKSSIRMFINLEMNDDPNLLATSSTGGWAELFPTQFPIKSVNDIKTSIKLLDNAYKKDLPKTFLDNDVPVEVVDDERGNGFVLESHLRIYLEKHIEEIEPGMQIYEEEDKYGVEYTTPIGRIDILAVDRDSSFVVIELKVGKGPDAASGQLMRYMSWVKRNMNNGKPVRGMIIAQRIPETIRYALADVEHIELKEYKLILKFANVPNLE